MPMNKALYPENWNTIALEVKNKAEWKCQKCDRQCTLPEGSHHDARDTLTVHHIDQKPPNCSRDNLVALCSGCHLKLHHYIRSIERIFTTAGIKLLPRNIVTISKGWLWRPQKPEIRGDQDDHE